MEEEWGKKGKGRLFDWVNFPSAWCIGSSQRRVLKARAAGTCSWEEDNGNCDDLGCQGSTALGSSFMYATPIQLQAAAEREGSGFSPSFPALRLPVQFCGHRMIWILWISSLNGQNC